MPAVSETILLKSLEMHTLTTFIKFYPNGRAEMVGMRAEKMYFPKKAVGKSSSLGVGRNGSKWQRKFLWKTIHD